MNTEVIAKDAADSIDSLVRQYVQGSHGQNKDQIRSVIHSAIEKACANLAEMELAKAAHSRDCLRPLPGTFVTEGGPSPDD
jgi:hypothetical protein